jgi:uncharacterized protein YvpB
LKKIIYTVSLFLLLSVIVIEFVIVVNIMESKSLNSVNRALEENAETTEVFIPVEVVLQNPELPNGCEITALTSVLNSYGYPVTKTEMADDYLPKRPFIRVDGDLYGPDPYKAYAGDPRGTGGFFSFAPPIVEAANSYLENREGTSSSIDISGSSIEEIIEFLKQSIPVVIWVTRDLLEPNLQYSWYLYDSNEHFLAPVNLHVVVLNGYTGGKVHVMDPLKGQVLYDTDTFFDSYQALGSHALIVNKA